MRLDGITLEIGTTTPGGVLQVVTTVVGEIAFNTWLTTGKAKTFQFETPEGEPSLTLVRQYVAWVRRVA